MTVLACDGVSLVKQAAVDVLPLAQIKRKA